MDSLPAISGNRVMKKALLATFGLIAIFVVGAVVAFIIDQPQFLSDPDFDLQPPSLELEADKPAILIFTKTNGFRHKEGIRAAQAVLSKLASARDWQVFTTENGAVHNQADLARFKVVIWANASGPLLRPDQRKALQHFIEQGGGFIGIHAAGDGSHKDWSWYQNTLLGTSFIGHTLIPHKQNALLVRQNDHRVLAGLPDQWRHYDEWYAFDRSPEITGATVLLTVDENSYKPGKFSMKPKHPVVWVKQVGRGRTLYSALGHAKESFDTPEYQQLIVQAIEWAGQLNPSGS